MKFEIMLKILFELLSKKCVKASYLAQKYEVSVRSIYRYIDALDYAGVPIYTLRGNQGGFAIVDTYKLSSTFMTVKEFESTINALTAISNSVPDKTLNSAIDKLKSAVKNEFSGFNIQSGNLIIDAGPWGDSVGYKSKLNIIHQSINECKKLFIRYHDRNGEITERTIDPHIVLFKQGLWYVFAYCNLRNEFRFFKTGRIEYANITKTTFNKQDLSKMNLPLNFWHNTEETTDVSLEIDKSCLSDVEEWLGIENVCNVSGSYIANVKLPIDNGLVSKIMSFGSGIKIISPTRLKDEVQKHAKKILDIYN